MSIGSIVLCLRRMTAVILVAAAGAVLPGQASASPASEWRLDFVIISVDPDAKLELYNPQGDSEDRLVERVKGVVMNGLLDATNGFFFGDRPVVLLAIVHQFDGLSTEATVLAGGEMRATIDVWFADAVTTEELTPVRRLDVSRVTLGNIGGIFAHFIGGSQTTRYSRSVSTEARGWLLGLDGLTTAAAAPAAVAAPVTAPSAPLPVVRAAPALPAPDVSPPPVLVDRSPVGGTPPVLAAAPESEPVVEPEPEVVAVVEAEPQPEVEEPSLLDSLFGSSESEAEPEPEVIAAVEPEPVPEPVVEEAEGPSLMETLFGSAEPEAVEPEAVPDPVTAPLPEPLDIATVDPVEPVLPPIAQPAAAAPVVESPAVTPPAPVTTAPSTPRVASVSPGEAGPTLANARWVGFSPAVFSGSDSEGGLWIAGPFDREQREGWVTDTATGSTTRVTFRWRDPSTGGPQAVLSREAAAALGLAPGQVANVAVYLPR